MKNILSVVVGLLVVISFMSLFNKGHLTPAFLLLGTYALYAIYLLYKSYKEKND